MLTRGKPGSDPFRSGCRRRFSRRSQHMQLRGRSRRRQCKASGRRSTPHKSPALDPRQHLPGPPRASGTCARLSAPPPRPDPAVVPPPSVPPQVVRQLASRRHVWFQIRLARRAAERAASRSARSASTCAAARSDQTHTASIFHPTQSSPRQNRLQTKLSR
jgi:hypothetical protein